MRACGGCPTAQRRPCASHRGLRPDAISRQCRGKGHQRHDCPSVGKPHGGYQKLLKQQSSHPQLSPRPRQNPGHSDVTKGRTVTAWKPHCWSGTTLPHGKRARLKYMGTARTKSTIIISHMRRNPALSQVHVCIIINQTDMAMK